MDAMTVIEKLHLQPLTVEGGHFREIYRSTVKTGDGRACDTSIYYLLRRGEESCWHRVMADEIWYYHAGTPVRQTIIDPDGCWRSVVIGADVANGEIPQSLIPAGSFQCAHLTGNTDDAWGLFGAAVFPAFTYEDFTGATVEEMRQLFPETMNEIEKQTFFKTEVNHAG